MSGDISLENEPIIFYSDQMTVSKVIVLKHKKINFNLYSKISLIIFMIIGRIELLSVIILLKKFLFKN